MKTRWIVVLFVIAVLHLGYWGLRVFAELARRASCRPEILLHECRFYAEEHEGMYPPLSPKYGCLTFDNNAIKRGVYLWDYFCEFDDDHPYIRIDRISETTPVNDWSYMYLGYFLENEAQGMAFIEAYRAVTEAGGIFENDLVLKVPDACHNQDILYRLREFGKLPPEAECLKFRAATIPLFIEWPGNHRDGAHVVYLDGHKEFVDYPGKFPMTKEFIEALHDINAEVYPAR